MPDFFEPVQPRVRNIGSVILLLAVVGILLRIALLVPHVQLLGDAASRYDPSARNLLLGNGFSASLTPPYAPNTYDVPGYPIFLAVVYALSGGSLHAVVGFQILLELSALMLVLPLAQALTLPDKVITIFLGIGLLVPFLWVHDGAVLSEITATFCITLVALLLLKAVDSENKGHSSWWALAGVVSGVCFLVRTDLISSVGLMLVASLLLMFIRGSTWTVLTWQASAFSVAMAAMLIPWTLWEYRATGELQIPGVQQVTHVFEDSSSSYFKWVSTWADDTRFFHDYAFRALKEPEKERHFPYEKLSQSDQERAKTAWALARQRGTFAGAPEDEFARLANEAIQRDPFKTLFVVPAERTIWAWLFVPANWLSSAPIPLKIAGYMLWGSLLVMAVIGMYGLLREHILAVLIPLALIIGRSIPSLLSILGSEPRYLVEALPVLYLLSAYGFFITILVVKQRLR